MRKNIVGLSLTLVTNDECEMMAMRKVMSGALVINDAEKTANFTEAAPKRAHTRNTKVWDGELLSMTMKENGVFQIHTKVINPLEMDNFPQRMFNEACAVLQKAEGK